MRLINMNRALENGLSVPERLYRTKARDFFWQFLLQLINSAIFIRYNNAKNYTS